MQFDFEAYIRERDNLATELAILQQQVLIQPTPELLAKQSRLIEKQHKHLMTYYEFQRIK